jgi:hypothetical protein
MSDFRVVRRVFVPFNLKAIIREMGSFNTHGEDEKCVNSYGRKFCKEDSS